MNKSVDLGLLIIRLGVGFSVLAFRAFGNLVGGSDLWMQSGSFILETGIDVAPELVGFTLALLECIGALMLITGILFRTGAILLLFTIIPGLIYQVSAVQGSAYAGLGSAFVSLILFSVYAGLLVTGPGSIAMRPFSRSDDTGAAKDPLPTFDSLG